VALLLVDRQAVLLPAAALPEAGLRLVVAWSVAALPLVAALFAVGWAAAAPADLYFVAAGQASLPAMLLRRAKSRLPLCVRVLLPLWPECAADQFP
jgi:hypothetical protein